MGLGPFPNVQDSFNPHVWSTSCSMWVSPLSSFSSMHNGLALSLSKMHFPSLESCLWASLKWYLSIVQTPSPHVSGHGRMYMHENPMVCTPWSIPYSPQHHQEQPLSCELGVAPNAAKCDPQKSLKGQIKQQSQTRIWQGWWLERSRTKATRERDPCKNKW